jgi:hypothetical protein
MVPIAMEGALPLGMLEGAEFSAMHFQMQPDDKLLIIGVCLRNQLTVLAAYLCGRSGRSFNRGYRSGAIRITAREETPN